MRKRNVFLNIATVFMVALLSVSYSPVPANAAGSDLRPATAAIGDSLVSGEGVAPYIAGSDTATDQCHRSSTSAVVLLHQLGLINLQINIACSGATTSMVTTTGQNGEPAQVPQLTPNLQLVYLSVGANDVDFGQLAGCFVVTNCESTPVPAATLALIGVLGPKLDTTYDAVRAKAPHARVVVSLYPPVLPADGSPVGPNCPELDPAEISIGNSFLQQLNDLITQHARAHGFGVIHLAPWFAGHDVCSIDPWFLQPDAAHPAAGFHPNQRGQIIIALADLLKI